MKRNAAKQKMNPDRLNNVAEINGNDYIYGTTPLYLRGSFNGTNWAALEAYKLEYVTNSQYEMVLKGVSLSEGDELKVADANWSCFEYGFGNVTDFSKSYFSNAGSNGNMRCNKTATYDVYARINHSGEYSVEFALSPEYLLSMAAANNYTRYTQINLSAEGYLELSKAEHSHFGSFNLTRTTLFVDNALYMHDGTTNVNSGYWTPAGTTKMYHYTLENGWNSINEKSNSFVKNFRLDSSTKTTNEWYINGMYLAAHASEIGAIMEYDYTNHNYYSVDFTTFATLLHDWMYITAPVYTNEDGVVVFTGVGLRDHKNNEVIYELYASGCEYLEGENQTIFSQATFYNIGTTSIPVLEGLADPQA